MGVVSMSAAVAPGARGIKVADAEGVTEGVGVPVRVRVGEKVPVGVGVALATQAMTTLPRAPGVPGVLVPPTPPPPPRPSHSACL